MKKVNLKEIKKDFSFLKEKLKKKEILAVILFGSHAKGKQHTKSDIDICVVVPKCKTIKEQANFLRYLWRNVNTNKYDIRLFEELPLYIKASVIKNHKPIYIGDYFGFNYYFYRTNKIWNDQSINWIEKKI